MINFAHTKQVAFLLGALIVTTAFTSSVQASSKHTYTSINSQLEGVQIDKYTYGMPLDISSVVLDSDLRSICGPVDTTMYYRNSSGELRGLEYVAWGNGCRDN